MTTPITELLNAHPLPTVEGDKRDRGVAVVVAGAPECPGAAVLTATAALRAGAGKVQIVTHPDLVTDVGVAVPEALVVGWDPAGDPTERVIGLLAGADAVLVGPGLDYGAADTARRLGAHVGSDTALVLDAQAIDAAADLIGHRLVVLPNVDEAGDLMEALGVSRHDDDPAEMSVAIASAIGATAAVRGMESVVSDGKRRWLSTGHSGLGTAGSGDVLAGIAVGFVARGSELFVAAGWAIATHAAAGRILGERAANPGYGYLARELLDVVPEAIASVEAGREQAQMVRSAG
jgi:ADP-dependent NAD(P)H-hydrate dehydratase